MDPLLANRGLAYTTFRAAQGGRGILDKRSGCVKMFDARLLRDQPGRYIEVVACEIIFEDEYGEWACVRAEDVKSLRHGGDE